MKNEINNWKNSKKYKEWIEELNKKKQDLIKLIVDMNQKEREDKDFTKEELKEILKLIRECDANHNYDDDDETFDFEYLSSIGDKNDILFEYTSRLVNWFYYLFIYLKKEDYEIATELRDVIQIEKSQMIILITKYRQDIIQKDNTFINRLLAIDGKLLKKIQKELEK